MYYLVNKSDKLQGKKFPFIIIASPNTRNTYIGKPSSTTSSYLLRGGSIIDKYYKIKYISKAGNQGLCGSCWAYAISGSLTDLVRYAEKDNSIQLSPSQLFSIINNGNLNSLTNGGCCGGVIDNVLQDIVSNSLYLLSKKCQDMSWYRTSCLDRRFGTEFKNDALGSCDEGISSNNKYNKLFTDLQGRYEKAGSSCFFSKNINRNLYYFKNQNVLTTYDDNNYMSVIISIMDSLKKNNGGVIGCIPIYQDFLNGSNKDYNLVDVNMQGDLKNNPHKSWEHGMKNDIYIANTDLAKYVGGHALAIIGWGFDPFLKKEYAGHATSGYYWMCRNSWGKDWGENGHCKIAMFPQNEYCQIVRNNNKENDPSSVKIGGGYTCTIEYNFTCIAGKGKCSNVKLGEFPAEIIDKIASKRMKADCENIFPSEKDWIDFHKEPDSIIKESYTRFYNKYSINIIFIIGISLLITIILFIMCRCV